VAKKPKPATNPVAPVSREETQQTMPEVVAPPVDTAATAREREAVRKKMDELVAQPAPKKAKPAPTVAAKPNPVKPPASTPPPAAAPSAAPSTTPPVATRPVPARPVRP